MKRALRTVITAGLVLMAASQVDAQSEQKPKEDRGFINISYAFQSRSETTLDAASTFAVYDETATVSSTQPVEGKGGIPDVAVGVRLYKRFGLGLAFNQISKESEATITAKIPHPLFYDQPRTATGYVQGLEHKEMAFHSSIFYFQPVTDRFDVTLSAGPTFFRLEQGTVGLSSLKIGADSAPYTSVSLTSVSKVATTKNVVGFNMGVDAAFRVTTCLRLGAFMRYATATANYTPEGVTEAIDVKLGGLQIGGGIRYRF